MATGKGSSILARKFGGVAQASHYAITRAAKFQAKVSPCLKQNSSPTPAVLQIPMIRSMLAT